MLLINYKKKTYYCGTSGMKHLGLENWKITSHWAATHHPVIDYFSTTAVVQINVLSISISDCSPLIVYFNFFQKNITFYSFDF